jgi:hypothetical protein
VQQSLELIENGSYDQAPTQMEEHFLQFQEERGHLKYTKETLPPKTSSYFFTMHAALQCLRITTILRTDTAAEIVVATADYSHNRSRRTPAKSSARHDRARTTPGTQLSLSLSLSLSLCETPALQIYELLLKAVPAREEQKQTRLSGRAAPAETTLRPSSFLICVSFQLFHL